MGRKEQTLLIAMGANVLLIGTKFLLASASGSLALKASAWHSFADLFVSALGRRRWAPGLRRTRWVPGRGKRPGRPDRARGGPLRGYLHLLHGLPDLRRSRGRPRGG